MHDAVAIRDPDGVRRRQEIDRSALHGHTRMHQAVVTGDAEHETGVTGLDDVPHPERVIRDREAAALGRHGHGGDHSRP